MRARRHCAIENVPDSVFADKLLGDGIAINPSNGEIISPIDGQVVMIQDAFMRLGFNQRMVFKY